MNKEDAYADLVKLLKVIPNIQELELLQELRNKYNVTISKKDEKKANLKLELVFHNEEIDMFREVLAKTQEGHILICEEQEVEFSSSKAVIFRLHSGTYLFALAYYTLGCRVYEQIISKRNYD
jgi:hypothetical protein